MNEIFRDIQARDLPLEIKAGQVMMCGFEGRRAGDARYLIQDMHVGGIILFSRNLGDPDEVRVLAEGLQATPRVYSVDLPLFLATDQEGGAVSRLTRGLPRWPSAMALAAACRGRGESDLVRRVYRAIGRELVSCGINTNFAPVLDINDNPRNPVIGTRSFGDDPHRVAELGVQAMLGLHDAGVVAVGKHFPGHGNTDEDSHATLPRVNRDLSALEANELIPFRAAVSSGIDAIMTAHVVYTGFDQDLPATLSPTVIPYLRNHLVFNGLIFTDCMEMSAIARGLGTAQGAVAALQAGADMVLVSHSREVQFETHRAIIDSVKRGQLPLARLDDAVNRLWRNRRKLPATLPAPLTATEFGAHAELRRLAFTASLTTTGNTSHIENWPRDGRMYLYCAREDGISLNARAMLRERLCGEGGFTVCEMSADDTCTNSQNNNSRDMAMVVVRNLAADEAGQGVLRKIRDHYRHCLVVGLGAPYDLAFCSDDLPGVCLFGADAQSLDALVRYMSGQGSAEGQAPVRISG